MSSKQKETVLLLLQRHSGEITGEEFRAVRRNQRVIFIYNNRKIKSFDAKKVIVLLKKSTIMEGVAEILETIIDQPEPPKDFDKELHVSALSKLKKSATKKELTQYVEIYVKALSLLRM